MKHENKITCNINKNDYIRIFKDEEYIIIQSKEGFSVNSIMLTEEKSIELIKLIEKTRR